jgi:hypothetical protein
MSRVCWNANSHGEYWIDVNLGVHSLQVLIDSGLIDRRGQVGFSIDESVYDQIKQAGGFQNHQLHSCLSANGQISLTESGGLKAQMVDPSTGNPVGPIVPISVFRGAPGVPNRVGLAFFHLLKGCRVLWELSKRSWCIEYP